MASWRVVAIAVAGFAVACGAGGDDVSGPPAMRTSAGLLSFSATIGEGDPPAQFVTVSNTGNGTLPAPTVDVQYALGYEGDGSWLEVTASGDSAPYEVTLQPRLRALPVGTYVAFVSLACSGASLSPQDVAVEFRVDGPSLSLSANSASFTGVRRGADPAPQVVTASNAGAGALAAPSVLFVDYPPGVTTAWLDVTVSGDAAPYAITLQPRISGLFGTVYTADVTVSCPGATQSPQVIAVGLTLTP